MPPGATANQVMRRTARNDPKTPPHGGSSGKTSLAAHPDENASNIRTSPIRVRPSERIWWATKMRGVGFTAAAAVAGSARRCRWDHPNSRPVPFRSAGSTREPTAYLAGVNWPAMSRGVGRTATVAVLPIDIWRPCAMLTLIRTSCRARPRSETQITIGRPVNAGERFAISKRSSSSRVMEITLQVPYSVWRSPIVATAPSTRDHPTC